jgi:hypothetical protein
MLSLNFIQDHFEPSNSPVPTPNNSLESSVSTEQNRNTDEIIKLILENNLKELLSLSVTEEGCTGSISSVGGVSISGISSISSGSEVKLTEDDCIDKLDVLPKSNINNLESNVREVKLTEEDTIDKLDVLPESNIKKKYYEYFKNFNFFKNIFVLVKFLYLNRKKNLNIYVYYTQRD